MDRVGLALPALAGGLPGELEKKNVESHQMKHVPELFGADGVIGAQRWCSTPRCREQRAVESDSSHPPRT